MASSSEASVPSLELTSIVVSCAAAAAAAAHDDGTA
jgi:hypothetical protein